VGVLLLRKAAGAAMVGNGATLPPAAHAALVVTFLASPTKHRLPPVRSRASHRAYLPQFTHFLPPVHTQRVELETAALASPVR